MVALREPHLIFPKTEGQWAVPKLVFEHFLRGDDLYQSGEFEQALHEYDAAVALRPDHPDILNNRGAALGHLGRHQEALAAYDRALALRPDDPDSLTNRGVTLGHLGRHPEALADFDRALALRPDQPATLYNIACLYSLWGRYDESLRLLERAIAGEESRRGRAGQDEDFVSLRAHPQFGPRFEKLISGKQD